MEEQLNSALSLIYQKEFEEAEKILFKLRSEDSSDPVINYQIGMLYKNYDNPNKSSEKAKTYFQYAISSEYVVERAYLELAKFEKSHAHALRLVKKGLEVFPNSVDLYERLLMYSDLDNREAIYQEIDGKNLMSDEIRSIMFDTYYRLNKFEDAIRIIDQINVDKPNDKLVKILIKAFCLLDSGNIKLAKNIFSRLIHEDINQKLDYAPYIGEILCCIREDKIENALKLFDQIPDEHEVSTQIYVYPILNFDYEKYFLDVLSYLEMGAKSQKTVLAKLRGLRGLFLYSINGENISSKIIKDLEYADRNIPSNTNYCSHLKFIYEDKNRYIDAFKACLRYLKNTSKEDYRWGEQDYYWKFIVDSDIDIMIQISDDFCEFISKEVRYSYEKYTNTILEPMVERLFKEKKYQQIIKIIELFKGKGIEQTDILFEIAYSYSEIDKFLLSKEYYEKYEEKVGVTSSSTNNLGILYEKFNDLSSAQQLFKKSLELNPESEKAKKNLTRVTELLGIKEKDSFEMKKAASDFLKEDVWTKSKVISFSKFKGLSIILCKLSY